MSEKAPVSPQNTAVSPPLSVGAGIADPGPLGLAGFAGTTFFLSVVNTNMLGAAGHRHRVRARLVLRRPRPARWPACGSSPRATRSARSRSARYGAFWLSFWYLLNHVARPRCAAPKVPDILHGVGVYLLVWTIFTAYMTVAASRTSGAVLVVFVLLTLTFLVLSIGFLSESSTDFEANSNGWINIGGWLGLVTALAAWYASFAAVTNSTFKRVVLPGLPAGVTRFQASCSQRSRD